MANLARLRREANELEIAGKHRHAAELYQEILKQVPDDAHTLLKLAEIRRHDGDLSAAAAAYRRVADLYDADGKEGKADAARKVADELRSAEPPKEHRSWWVRLFGRSK